MNPLHLITLYFRSMCCGNRNIILLNILLLFPILCSCDEQNRRIAGDLNGEYYGINNKIEMYYIDANGADTLFCNSSNISCLFIEKDIVGNYSITFHFTRDSWRKLRLSTSKLLGLALKIYINGKDYSVNAKIKNCFRNAVKVRKYSEANIVELKRTLEKLKVIYDETTQKYYEWLAEALTQDVNVELKATVEKDEYIMLFNEYRNKKMLDIAIEYSNKIVIDDDNDLICLYVADCYFERMKYPEALLSIERVENKYRAQSMIRKIRIYKATDNREGVKNMLAKLREELNIGNYDAKEKSELTTEMKVFE